MRRIACSRVHGGHHLSEAPAGLRFLLWWRCLSEFKHYPTHTTCIPGFLFLPSMLLAKRTHSARLHFGVVSRFIEPSCQGMQLTQTIAVTKNFSGSGALETNNQISSSGAQQVLTIFSVLVDTFSGGVIEFGPPKWWCPRLFTEHPA